MFPRLRRAARRLHRRALRPVVALSLVLAQCAAVFGYPVVGRAGEVVRRCGCKVRGPSEACCCGPRECCAGVAGQAIPEPEQPTCPKCKVKQSAKSAAPAPPAPPADSRSVIVGWAPGVKARQCHGDGPGWLAAADPAVPPAAPARPAFAPPPTDFLAPGDRFAASVTSAPPEPPPRRG